jgi:hypothetical protein
VRKVDSAMLLAPIVRDTLHKPAAPLTIEVYDVDTTATDTVAAVLLPLFRPDRFLGATTFAPESLKDTLRLPISNEAVLDRVTNGKRLRVGFRLVSAKSADLAIRSTQIGSGVTLRFRGSLDTTSAAVTVTPLSRTPAGQAFLSIPLADYAIVAKGGSTTNPAVLSVGGVPARRSYLRFTVPSSIVDSSTVVRASLLLTQRPSGVDRSDTIHVYPVAVLAAPTVTSVFTALQFLAPAGGLGLTTPLLTVPGDSGVKSIEIVALVRTWRGAALDLNPRVVALRSGDEGLSAGGVEFFSMRAAPNLRPRLRLTYVPPTAYGVP